MEINYKLDPKTLYKYRMNCHMGINFIYLILFSIGYFVLARDLVIDNFFIIFLIYLLLITLLYIILLVMNSLFTLISLKIKPVECNYLLHLNKNGIKINGKLIKWNEFNKINIKSKEIVLQFHDYHLIFTNKEKNYNEIKDIIVKYGKKVK